MIQVPVHDDIDEPPDPLRCPRCGTHWPWSWHKMPVRIEHPRHPLFGPRWTAPSIDPCASCAQDPNYERKRQLDRRVEFAGFPVIPFVLHQRLLFEQEPSQSDESFMAMVKRHNERVERVGEEAGRPMLGGLQVNARGVKALLRWAQTKSTRSIFLHGPPGVGKTLLMCALGRLLLQADTTLRRFYVDKHGRKAEEAPEDWDRSRRTAISSQKPRDVVYTRLDVLMAEQRDRFKGRAQPVRKMGTYPGVLFFDELGISNNPIDWELDTVNHVLGERFDRNLPTVISSNLNPQGFQGVYGPRVGSRLRTCIIIEIQGPDWRG